VTISGVTEPIIGQRNSKSTIQLRDGEPCLLAGILSKTDTINVSGTPGLAEVPILKYIFGSNFREAAQDEVVFILIPHVVRESTLTRLNTRAVDTGTANDIQIRQTPTALDALFPDSAAAKAQAPSNTSAANAAAAMVEQMKQQAMPPTPGTAVPPPTMPEPASQPQPGATAPPQANQAPTAAPVALLVNPPDSTQNLNSTFRTSVVLAGGHDVYSVPVQLQFDPKVLQLVSVQEGGLLGKDGQPVALVHRDEGNGLVTISASRPPGARGVNGDGQICILTFKAIGSGDSKISLVKVGAKNSSQVSLPAVGSQATVHVK
jgi:general secretion pathway protein D